MARLNHRATSLLLAVLVAACGAEESAVPMGSGGAGGGGSDESSTGASSTGGGASSAGAPRLLSETGLFEPGTETIGSGVQAFQPQFELWTDGADKRRWIWLPEGAMIDSSDQDYWKFPVGTKLWKEFSRDGVRVETRLLEKLSSGSWTMMAYLWREDLSDADAVVDGAPDARGTQHDVPAATLCAECHARVPDRVLGFSAVQLAKLDTDEASVDLGDLIEQGRLTKDPGPIALPGSETEQQALGYLHANCGHCHNARSSISAQVPMYLWLGVDELGVGEVSKLRTYDSTWSVALTKGNTPEGVALRVAPGQPQESGIYARMNSRGHDYSMPPLGTETTDEQGLLAIEAWIAQAQK